VHDNEGSSLGVEPPKRSIEQVSLGNDGGNIAGRLDVEGTKLHFHRASPAATSEGETGANGQAIQPGIEPFRVAQARKIPPCSDQRLLDRVLREHAVPKYQASGSVQPRSRRVREDCEGVMIAPLRSLDEAALVHRRLRYRTAPTAAL